MSIDTFMKIKGVDGESQKKDHEKEIELLSWQWSVNQPSSVGSGVGGMSRGKAVPGEFIFSHYYDNASPTIKKVCANGQHFEEVKVTCRQAGEGQKDFLTITMKGCLISSAAPAASAGGDVIENVAMAFSSIEFDYKPKDAKGQLGGSVKMSWDVVKGNVQ